MMHTPGGTQKTRLATHQPENAPTVTRRPHGSRVHTTVRVGMLTVHSWALAAGVTANGPLRTDLRDIHLHSIFTGDMQLTSLGQPGTILTPRTALFTIDPSQVAVQTLTETRGMTVSLPQESIQPAPFGPLGIRVVPRPSPLLTAFIAFCATLFDETSGELTNLSRYYLERLAVEMMTGVIVDASRTDLTPLAAKPIDVATTIIASQFANPNLTADDIAREVRISRRQLERLFAQRGLTIAKAIRQARVQHARDLLTDPTYSMLTVNSIAQHCGFSNGSSLARAMATENMPPPATLRAGTQP